VPDPPSQNHFNPLWPDPVALSFLRRNALTLHAVWCGLPLSLAAPTMQTDRGANQKTGRDGHSMSCHSSSPFRFHKGLWSLKQLSFMPSRTPFLELDSSSSLLYAG